MSIKGGRKEDLFPLPSFCRYPFRKAGFLPYISPLLLKSQDKALQCFYPECFHALVLAHTEGFPQSENVTAFREVGIRLPTWRKTQFATKWGIRLPHFLSWPSHELRIRQRSCVFGACASTSRLVARNVREDVLYEARKRETHVIVAPLGYVA